MRLLNLFELQKRWESPAINNGKTMVLAFRGVYWLIGEYGDGTEVPVEVIQDINQHLGINLDTNDPEEFMTDIMSIQDDRPDLILGTIYKSTLHLNQQEAGSHHPYTSSMLMKLVQDLGLTGVTVEGMDWAGEEETTRYTGLHKMQGELPKMLFHGTSSEYMRKIAATGIRPGLNSNWDKAGIRHDNIIFGSVDKDGAMFHANKTAGRDPGDDHMDPDDPYPVLLLFTIPDPSKLIPDYDVAAEMIGQTTSTDQFGYTGQRGFYRTHNPDIANQNPEGRAWKNTGVFGYAGRIPPSHIIRVHTDFFDEIYMSEPRWSGSLKDFFKIHNQHREEYDRAHEDEDNEDS